MNDRPILRIDAALAAGMDHVRLSYHYLDIGDLDGYRSLFEDGAELGEPVTAVLRGRAGAVRYRYTVFDVFGSDRRLAAVGRMVELTGSHALDFVDLFTVSDSALLVERRCFVGFPPDGYCQAASSK